MYSACLMDGRRFTLQVFAISFAALLLEIAYTRIVAFQILLLLHLPGDRLRAARPRVRGRHRRSFAEGSSHRPGPPRRHLRRVGRRYRCGRLLAGRDHRNRDLQALRELHGSAASARPVFGALCVVSGGRDGNRTHPECRSQCGEPPLQCRPDRCGARVSPGGSLHELAVSAGNRFSGRRGSRGVGDPLRAA